MRNQRRRRAAWMACATRPTDAEAERAARADAQTEADAEDAAQPAGNRRGRRRVGHRPDYTRT
jgi:formylglycine-generating enzyme required for sulfatase activity